VARREGLVSLLSVPLLFRGEAIGALNVYTGQPHGFRGDVASVAKRDLRAGEMLDGEGGYTVWGKLVPAERSLAEGALPIGLAHRVPLMRDIAAGKIVRWADIAIPDSEATEARRDMERRFAGRPSAIAAAGGCESSSRGLPPAGRRAARETPESRPVPHESPGKERRNWLPR